MVDLNEAGRRLANYRAGPTPPIADLRRRAVRRAHRRHLVQGTGAAAIVVALIVTALTVLSSNGARTSQQVTTAPTTPPGPAVTAPGAPSGAGASSGGGVTYAPAGLPAITHPAGSTPVDWDQLRLWLPAGWAVAAPTGRCWTAVDRVYFSTVGPGGCGPGTGLWVTPLAASIPRNFATVRINGLTVRTNANESFVANTTIIDDVPVLGVTIYGRGAASDAVADTLGPSALHSVLAQRYPTAIPAGWKTVTFDGFSADVPPTWPTRAIRVVSSANSVRVFNDTGICGSKVFRQPALYLGIYTGGYHCPAAVSATPGLQQHTAPIDGLWLQDSTSPSQAARQTRNTGGPIRTLRSTTADLTASYQTAQGADTVAIDLTVNGRTLQTVIGLGVEPATAEEVISSLRPAAAETVPTATSTTRTSAPPAADAGLATVVRATPLAQSVPSNSGPRYLTPGAPVPTVKVSARVRASPQVSYGLANLGGSIWPAISTDRGRTWRIDGPLFVYPAEQGADTTSAMGTLSANVAYAWGELGNYVKITYDAGQQWWIANIPGQGVYSVSRDGLTLRARTLGPQTVTGKSETFLYISSDQGRTWTLHGQLGDVDF